MKHPIGETRNGITVFVDLIHSEAAKHIAQQPHLLNLAAEALQKTSVHGPRLNVEHDMGRDIGYSFIIPTTEGNTVFYAQLQRDEVYTRFIKNGKPLTTQHLSLLLRRNTEDKTYELHDVWVGRLSPPRPGSADETDESKTFWSTHALILDKQPLQLRTVTKVCPY